jgi:hypothetical protein
MKRKSRKKKDKNGKTRGLKFWFILFPIPFALVAAFMLLSIVNTIRHIRSASGWEVVPCHVLSVKLDSQSDSDSTTYKCLAEYTYTYAGKQYRSDRISFYSGYDNIGSYWQDCCRTLKNSQQKDTLVCRVKAADPSEAIIFTDIRWGMIGFQLIFVVAFGGVGFGMLWYGLFGYRRGQRHRKKLEADNPDQPWAWNPKWASGIIKSSDKAGMVVIIIFALIWNAIALPVGILAFVEGFLRLGNRLALLGLIFPMVGLGLLAGAAYMVARYIKYGRTIFEMAEMPGVIGGRLAGLIEVPVNIVPEDGFEINLRCIHRYVVQHDEDSTTKEEVLWEDSMCLASEVLAKDKTRTALPVLFAIPYDARESSVKVGNDGIVWQLSARARVKGINFSSKFDVPVFRTPNSSPDFVLDDSAIRPYLVEEQADAVFRRQGARVTETSGGICYYFPAARNKSLAVGVTIAAVALIGVVALVSFFGLPWFVLGIFGLIGLFMSWMSLKLWLVSSKIEVAHRMVTITRGALGLAVPKEMPLKNISDIFCNETSSSGSTSYYAIKLESAEGRKITLADGIVGRKDADEIVAHIRNSISEL